MKNMAILLAVIIGSGYTVTGCAKKDQPAESSEKTRYSKAQIEETQPELVESSEPFEEAQKRQTKDIRERMASDLPRLLRRLDEKYKAGTLYVDPIDESIQDFKITREKRAVPTLIKILGNYHIAHARAEAAEALGAIADSRAIPVLKNALQDEDQSVRVEAAVALVKMGEHKSAFPLLADTALKKNQEDWKIDLEYLLDEESKGRERVAERRQYIKDWKEEVLPVKAIDALSQANDEKALNVLTKCTRDGNGFVRLRSSSHLMGTKYEEIGLEVLRQIIKNPQNDKFERSSALYAVVKANKQKAIMIINEYINDPDPYIAKNARGALKRTEEPGK